MFRGRSHVHRRNAGGSRRRGDQADELDRLRQDPDARGELFRRAVARYRADAATRNVTILGPSFANTRDSANKLRAYFPTAANYMTVGNAHSYPGGREPDGRYGGGWGISLADALARQRMGSSKPVWASECGYKLSGSRSGHHAVTERAAAKYMGRVILSHLGAGAPAGGELQRDPRGVPALAVGDVHDPERRADPEHRAHPAETAADDPAGDGLGQGRR